MIKCMHAHGLGECACIGRLLTYKLILTAGPKSDILTHYKIRCGRRNFEAHYSNFILKSVLPDVLSQIGNKILPTCS